MICPAWAAAPLRYQWTVRKLIVGVVALLLLVVWILPTQLGKRAPAISGTEPTTAATSTAPTPEPTPTPTAEPATRDPLAPRTEAMATTALGQVELDATRPALTTIPPLPTDDAVPGTAVITFQGKWEGTLAVNEPDAGYVACDRHGRDIDVFMTDVPISPQDAARKDGGETYVHFDAEVAMINTDTPRLVMITGFPTDDGEHWSGSISTFRGERDLINLAWDGQTLRFAALVVLYRPPWGNAQDGVAVTGLIRFEGVGVV